MIEPIFADALGGLQRYFEEMPGVANSAARMAINDVAKGEGLALLRKEVADDIAFPPGYLQDHLNVWKLASEHDLTAVIAGRDRPTSLARFAPGQTPVNGRKRGVRVTVHPGESKMMKGAWMINLRNGNIGLAIRLKPGETLYNKHDMASAVSFGNGVYLLYGPSVDQVFRWVADDSRPQIADMVAAEFYRQFGRLSHNG